MGEVLTSVGIDVGTTSTQTVLSELTVENRAGSFSVPEMEITGRRILYKSPVHFTPLLGKDRVDGDALRALIEQEYERAGIARENVDTGAIIITGETSRKENAAAVLHALAGFAGEFVVATAGPELESILAAKGAGADRYSEKTGMPVLHMDIGGGTCNLALIENGRILRCGCLNVGGRLIRLDGAGKISCVSPVLDGLCDLKIGDAGDCEPVAELMVRALEMAAGLRQRTELLDRLWTREAGQPWVADAGKERVISFSGGVADCIARAVPALEYGDMGPVLGRCIRRSRLCRGAYVLGSETIRATVIGAGCHSAQLSGSTVYYQNVKFPLKNMPVTENFGEPGTVLALTGPAAPAYPQLHGLAGKIADAHRGGLLAVCIRADMAKALGQALALRLGPEAAILCIDRVGLKSGDYLDVGSPVGPALPVVVKTLAFGGR